MKKKIVIFLTAAMTAAAYLSGCGSSASYKDGTYSGKSSTFTNDDGTDEGNGYGEVSITIKDGSITACDYKTYTVDGTLKGEDYGKQDGEIKNRDYYNKAQKALAAADQYAKELVSYGKTSDIKNNVDAISGATINYDHFLEAVDDALDQAKE